MKTLHKNIRWLVGLALLAMVTAPFAGAQFKEDAQRLALPGLGTGARSLGMGNAYTGIASDFTALYWNPAGLAQAKYGEFSFGLSYLDARDKSTFFSSQLSSKENALTLNSLGFVLPVPVRRGSFAVAFGFNRQSTFTSGLAFNGYNTLSSIIQAWAPNNQPYPDQKTLAEDLWVASIDTLTGKFISPILNNVSQQGTVTESGGLNNWSVGGAMDVARNLSFGITLTYVAGSYRYDREYREGDPQRVHATPYDLRELLLKEYVEDDISGVNAKFGLMFRDPERFRLSFTAKTPTSFNIKESYGSSAQSTFRTADASGYSTYGPFDDDQTTEYDVHTPWVLGAGLSFTLANLTLSGDAEYTDWTQTTFTNANKDLLDQNRDFKNVFRSTFNLRGGGELELPRGGVRLRGGFIYITSIYKGDPSSFDQKYWTAGVGLPLGESTMLDVGYAHGWWNTYRVNYSYLVNGGESSRVNERISTNTFLVTFSHRF